MQTALKIAGSFVAVGRGGPMKMTRGGAGFELGFAGCV